MKSFIKKHKKDLYTLGGIICFILFAGFACGLEFHELSFVWFLETSASALGIAIFLPSWFSLRTPRRRRSAKGKSTSFT